MRYDFVSEILWKGADNCRNIERVVHDEYIRRNGGLVSALMLWEQLSKVAALNFGRYAIFFIAFFIKAKSTDRYPRHK